MNFQAPNAHNPSPFRLGRCWIPLEHSQTQCCEPEFAVPSTPPLLQLIPCHFIPFTGIFLQPNPSFAAPHPLIFCTVAKNSATTFKMIHLQAPTSQLHLEQDSDLRFSMNFCLHWGLIFLHTVCITVFFLCFLVQMSNSFCQPAVSFLPAQ